MAVSLIRLVTFAHRLDPSGAAPTVEERIAIIHTRMHEGQMNARREWQTQAIQFRAADDPERRATLR